MSFAVHVICAVLMCRASDLLLTLFERCTLSSGHTEHA